MSSGTGDWAADQHRTSLIGKFTKWKALEANPKENGKPLELTNLLLRLQSQGGRIVTPYNLEEIEDWSPVLIVDMVLEEVDIQGGQLRKGGIEPIFALCMHFGNRQQQTCEISLSPRVTVEMEQHPSFPTTSLTDPRNMGAQIVANNIQQGMHKDTLFYQVVGGMVGKYSELVSDVREIAKTQNEFLKSAWDRIKTQDEQIDKMREADRQRAASDLDLEIKRMNAQLITKLKMLGAETLMPILSVIGANLVKKTGKMMGIAEMDIDDTQVKIAKHIASDPKKMEILFDGMDDQLKNETFMAIQAMGAMEARKKLTLTAQAGMEGVTRPKTIEQFYATVKQLRAKPADKPAPEKKAPEQKAG